MEKSQALAKKFDIAVDFSDLSKRVSALVKKAGDIFIKNDKDMLTAVEISGMANIEIKRIEADRVEKVKPLKDYIKMIENEYASRLAPLKKAKDALGAAVSEYRMRKEKAIAKENQKIAKKAGEIGVAPPPVRVQEKTVSTQTAQVIFSKVKDYEIVDESKLPDQYVKRVPNLSAIRAAVNSGVAEIPGIRIFTKEIQSYK